MTNSGVDLSGVVGIAIALAAFLVAVLTLYLTALRHAELVAFVGSANLPAEIRGGSGISMEDGSMWPNPPILFLPVAIQNVGARAGVLRRIELAEWREDADQQLFNVHCPTAFLNDWTTFPAGDLRAFQFTPDVPLSIPWESGGDAPRSEMTTLRQRLSEGRRCFGTLKVEYLRAPGRLGRHRRGVIESFTVPFEISLQALRSSTQAHT